MKPLHLQAAIAVFGLAAVGLGMGALKARGDRDLFAERIAALEKKRDGRDAQRPGGGSGAPKPASLRDYDAEAAVLGKRVKELEDAIARARADIDRISAENEALRRELAAAAGGGGEGGKLGAQLGGGAAPTPPGPPPMVVEAEPAPTAIPDGPGPAQPWGRSDEAQLDDLSIRLKLNPEQRDEVRKIYTEQKLWHQDRIKEVMLAAAQSGAPDPEKTHAEIMRVTEDVWKRTQERVRQILYPEQAAEYRKLCQEIEQARRQAAGQGQR